MLKQLICIDYGKRRIGLASGQTITKTASPLQAISAKFGLPDWTALDKVIKTWNPNYIIIGLPIDTNGEYTKITKDVEVFGTAVNERYSAKVHYMNEAYSTREARWQLEKTTNKSVNHLKVDSLAACVILESWMENNCNE
ncbi:MAG: putative Holliday junction resolvase [Francisellaceae bacterium]|jgi:putative Holliday junction resolvase